MNKQVVIAGIIGLIAGVLILPLLTPVTPWSGGMAGQIDAHFIEQMIPHHEDAIFMADLALEKAKHQEIRQLAQDIKRTQSEEIDQMRAWYKSWFGDDVSDVFSVTGHGMGSSIMHMGMMGDATDIARLSNSSDFDKAFIEEMIPHHQMAVMMATMLQTTTSRPEMKQLAKNIIDAQSREINSMRQWYRQWYGQ